MVNSEFAGESGHPSLAGGGGALNPPVDNSRTNGVSEEGLEGKTLQNVFLKLLAMWKDRESLQYGKKTYMRLIFRTILATICICKFLLPLEKILDAPLLLLNVYFF